MAVHYEFHMACDQSFNLYYAEDDIMSDRNILYNFYATRHYSEIVLLGSLVRCFLGQVGLHSLFVSLCLTQC